MKSFLDLFRGPGGKNFAVTFALVSTLFFLWGFCNGMIDVLNKHFQNSLRISKFESGFVQFANFIGYFCMAIPSGLLARRFGYKGGILIGRRFWRDFSSSPPGWPCWRPSPIRTPRFWVRPRWGRRASISRSRAMRWEPSSVHG
jgi:hypothetical protein